MYHDCSLSHRFQESIFQDVLRFQDVQELSTISKNTEIIQDLLRFTKIPRSSKMNQDSKDFLRFPDVDPFQNL